MPLLMMAGTPDNKGSVETQDLRLFVWAHKNDVFYKYVPSEKVLFVENADKQILNITLIDLTKDPQPSHRKFYISHFTTTNHSKMLAPSWKDQSGKLTTHPEPKKSKLDGAAFEASFSFSLEKGDGLYLNILLTDTADFGTSIERLISCDPQVENSTKI